MIEASSHKAASDLPSCHCTNASCGGFCAYTSTTICHASHLLNLKFKTPQDHNQCDVLFLIGDYVFVKL